MTEMMVKIMVEVLDILAIATKEVEQTRPSESIPRYWPFLAYLLPEKYLKNPIGKNDIRDALRRLDMLTQEEVLITKAEALKIMHSVDDKVKVLMDGMQYEVIQSPAPS